MLSYYISVHTFPPDIFADLKMSKNPPKTNTEDRFTGAVSRAVGPPGSVGSLLHEGDMAGTGTRGPGDGKTGEENWGNTP